METGHFALVQYLADVTAVDVKLPYQRAGTVDLLNLRACGGRVGSTVP